ncbi:ATP-binding cassette domain-containing protein [Staphylococcus auricularis]|uniref:ATP-binding cassette domain-containing protein n=1 Tax=Staphylococcus auricularis TaxID=29379 RepID=UPI003EBF0152
MIQIDNLAIKKSDKFIFEDFSYTFESGKSYALMGHSGCGKSTLLNAIAGFEKYQQGEIKVNGKKLKANTQYYRKVLGYLFQNFALIDNETVSHNLDIGLAFQKGSKAKKEAKKKSYLAALGLADIDLKRKVSTLSGGEQQRLSLIRMLMKDPKIILADEPTGSLDKDNGEVILHQLLDSLTDQKVIIIATHDLDIAKQCDTIVNLEQHVSTR